MADVPGLACAACGHVPPPGARFCEECGRAVPLRCSACGGALRAGAKFCGGCGTQVEAVAHLLAPVAPSREGDLKAAADDGELRQLTVLFCDLVGSTALSTALDPEEYREVVGAYQRDVTLVIARYGGHVAQFQGDGIVAYFGYPEAHGDDAERAVRAGLGIVLALQGTTRPAVRVGMHSGRVVVGAMSGGGHAEVLALGETPNIAARVQGLAEPGTVLITDATHRLVAGLFVVEEAGAHLPRGITTPLTVYRVRQASGVRSRLRAAATLGFTPFVGREQERRLLRDRWEQACDGDGQVVLITGEPGIGKSRLLQQFREDLGGAPHTWIECWASSYEQHTPFAPVTDMLRQGFVWEGAASPAARLTELERGLEAAGLRPEEAVPLVAPMLDMPLGDRYGPPLLAPEQARRKLMATLAGWVFGVARMQPLVLAIEDLHWSDPSTLELLTILVEQTATAPVFLVLTARPEFHPPWLLRAHHTQIVLNHLSRRHVREMIARVTARVVPPPDVIDAIAARTDGVPLFVEELTRAILETEGTTASYREVPATLEDSLMARLDRLGPAKEVAQVGAVLGREFSYGLLQPVSGLPDGELQAALSKLADAELLYARGLPPEARYLFKHALIQDTAYASLLRSRQRELHRATARTLTERFPETAEAHPELLAHHWTQAGEAEPAIDAWQQAGGRAAARSAHAEAITHLTKGLTMLATLPDAPSRTQRELMLRVPLCQALAATTGYGGTALAGEVSRVRELCEQLGAVPEMFLAVLGFWAASRGRGELRVAQEFVLQIARMADRDGSGHSRVWAHVTEGITRFHLGEFPAAGEALARAIALYDAREHERMVQDPGVAAFGHAAVTAWHCGHADEARRHDADGRALARSLGKPFEETLADTLSGILHIYLREPEHLLEEVDAREELCRAQGFQSYRGHASAQRGWAWAETGRRDEGIAQLQEALAVLLQAREVMTYVHYTGVLAQVLFDAGRFDEAVVALEEAQSVAPEVQNERPELLRLRAVILAEGSGDTSQIEASYREALAASRKQGTRAYELRATTHFGRWLKGVGRASEALALLAPLHASFIEGFDTRDLREAQALLEELR